MSAWWEAEGLCHVCGEVATSRDSHSCDTCSELVAYIASERKQQDELIELERYERELAMTHDDGSWDRREHLSMANAHFSMSNVHFARRCRARDRLDARELAFTTRIEATRALPVAS